VLAVDAAMASSFLRTHDSHCKAVIVVFQDSRTKTVVLISRLPVRQPVIRVQTRRFGLLTTPLLTIQDATTSVFAALMQSFQIALDYASTAWITDTRKR